MTVIELPGATVALTAITDADGATPRQRERGAVARLMTAAAGRPVAILHRTDGAPYPEGCDGMHISISHSRHVAALLWSGDEGWGIDIEECDRCAQLQRIAPRVLTEPELQVYKGKRLVEAWTLKEAAYKAWPAVGADLRCIGLPLATDDCIINSDGRHLRIAYSAEVAADGWSVWLSAVYSL